VEKRSFVSGYYVGPLREYAKCALALRAGADCDVLALLGARHVLALYRTYCEVTAEEGPLPDPDSEFWRFFASDEFRNVPYVDVSCSLRAAALVDPDREPEEGDRYDMDIMAVVLPYCDIVATDRYMKSLIQWLGLDAKYGVEVFSARKADLPAFLTRLTALAGVEECQPPSPLPRPNASRS
jgi:hypothetical protein